MCDAFVGGYMVVVVNVQSTEEVYPEMVSELLVELVGVRCPQGTKVDVEGKEFVCRGYIPGRQSCLSIRSTSPVILSMMALVSNNSENSLMSSYAVRSSMTGKSSSVL